MEAGESVNRQSGIPTASNLEQHDRRPREGLDTSYREIPSMATAALVSPSGPSSYHSHHSSYSSGYPHSALPTGMPGMISPVDSRRASDDSEGPHRQSLPSISEVIGATKPPSYGPPAPAPLPPTQSLPSPFSTSAPPRPFGDVVSDKNPSPRTLHPASGYPRADTLPAFSDPSRPAALSGRPGPPPPLNTFPPRHPSPPVKLEQHHPEAEQRHPDSHQFSQPPPSLYTPPAARPPPGQLPLPQFPVSPRHNGPALPSPFDPQRAPLFGDEREHSQLSREGEYRSTLDKAFESWGYNEALSIISTSSRAVNHFADAYIAAAREQQGSQPIPSRLPTDNEVNAMISTSLHVLQKLEEVRDIVQQNRISMERARENGAARKPMEEEDVPMYGDGMKQGYPITNEVKKRRGRAAPPGRCHSCNRIDTPEWRRGPDGARTLCNACGLHYAKLERRRQLDQRSSRPKTADERS